MAWLKKSRVNDIWTLRGRLKEKDRLKHLFSAGCEGMLGIEGKYLLPAY